MERMVLRLYVAGDGPNSAAARVNLRRLLGRCDPATYTLEIVDCLRQPMRACAIENGPHGLSPQRQSCATNVGGFVGCSPPGNDTWRPPMRIS